MENYQGDLTDILRATSGSLSQQPDPSSWEFDRPPLITTTTSSHTPLLKEVHEGRFSNPAFDFFGDPFCDMRDPLLHELDIPTSTYFDDSATTNTTMKVNDGSCNKINMLSRIQISPAPNNKPPLLLPSPPPQRSSDNNNNTKSLLMAACPSPAGFKVAAAASGLVLRDRIINVSSSKSCLIDGPVQISSPRNLGIKRRKSQAKKVVCIPAPAAPNSRPSGEVVPSDLWAWRKYGQKPIKGSPYPRGYYRCSSSKGCPARKQVERSRTDPNMLVITYTSEHNHPWPTQRNALAGSTRAQPPKSSNVGSKINSPTTSHMKEESSNDEAALSPHNNNMNIGSGGASSSAQVKEEVEEEGKQMEHENVVLDEGFSYRPAMPDQDFFAELGEIDGDPLELLFLNEEDVQKQGNKGGGGLDPFGLFDWPSVDSQSSAPFGEARRGL